MGPVGWALNGLNEVRDLRGDVVRSAMLSKGKEDPNAGIGSRLKSWASNKLGVMDKKEAADRAARLAGAEYKTGIQVGKQRYGMDSASDADVYKQATARFTKKVGQVGSDIGAGAGDAIKKGMTGVRQGLEDNPAGIAGAAAGALAAGWGLSKLRRKKAPV